MLPIAALIVSDSTGRTFAGMDLNERAALVASDAGIHHCYFLGSRLPDLSAMRRLRARGAFTIGLLGWPRVFAGVPNAEIIVVIDARTILDAALLRATVQQAIAHGGRAALLVDQGPQRKDSLIQVENGRVTSVIGDGNGTNCGVLVLPQSLVARVRTVYSLRDAVHRLAKADLLAAVPTGGRFCRVLDSRGGVAAVEREYARAKRTSVWHAMSARIAALIDSFTPAQSGVPETM
ncbi:MAG TPA: hypothetical protein VM096_16400 [Vicinamibacterales bacterium]|nr:hypothetical protein [Vicinamibacterales bacterium]